MFRIIWDRRRNILRKCVGAVMGENAFGQPPAYHSWIRKDMAGVCPPTFYGQPSSLPLKSWPDLVMHYHRHYTDGLFVPACGAAAKLERAYSGCWPWRRSPFLWARRCRCPQCLYLENELGLKCHFK